MNSDLLAFSSPEIGVWGEVKGRQQLCARHCAAGALQTFSQFDSDSAVELSPICYRVRNGDSERLGNLSKHTQPGRSRSGIPAPVLLSFHRTAVASGPPAPFPGTAGSTMPFHSSSFLLPLTPPSYWTLLLIFSTFQQTVRATFPLSEREAQHLRATNSWNPMAHVTPKQNYWNRQNDLSLNHVAQTTEMLNGGQREPGEEKES